MVLNFSRKKGTEPECDLLAILGTAIVFEEIKTSSNKPQFLSAKVPPRHDMNKETHIGSGQGICIVSGTPSRFPAHGAPDS